MCMPSPAPTLEFVWGGLPWGHLSKGVTRFSWKGFLGVYAGGVWVGLLGAFVPGVYLGVITWGFVRGGFRPGCLST